MNDDPIILSEDGRRRQQEILQAALHASRSRKRRRSIRDGTLTLFVILLATPWILHRLNINSRVAPPIGQVNFHVDVPKRVEPVVMVNRIETDPNILQRLSLPPITSTARHIGDAELMRELADAHQPAGLITVNGKSQLVFR